jgi:hypothetical protein
LICLHEHPRILRVSVTDPPFSRDSIWVSVSSADICLQRGAGPGCDEQADQYGGEYPICQIGQPASGRRYLGLSRTMARRSA